MQSLPAWTDDTMIDIQSFHISWLHYTEAEFLGFYSKLRVNNIYNTNKVCVQGILILVCIKEFQNVRQKIIFPAALSLPILVIHYES